jgi:thiamine-monophosphate kinase
VTLRQVGELELVRLVRKMASVDLGPGVLMGIGDDAAVLALPPGASLLATTDLLIEGVHFRLPPATPADVGWKALAVNLSDIAAMGGAPRYALVALALPESAEVGQVEAFFDGMQQLARCHRVAVVGGDTSSAPRGWMVNVTVLGEHRARPRLRADARAGDLIGVTGSLGRSAAGFHVLEAGRAETRSAGLSAEAEAEVVGAHLRPTPRVAEGSWLGAAESVHAMMDCSDGLATDLAHICRESGVGARVEVDRLPIAAATRAAAAALQADAVQWAAAGGEDYELLVTLDAAGPAVAQGLAAATGTTLTVIGEIVADNGLTFVDGRGRPVSVGPGYEHFRA